ncbi:MAG: hypothetical protein GX784_05270 [Firmicutes bacterium]|nr:hypothetical protein [Candidatus Fermentithermobacillaceae bacterium]
MRLRSRKHNRRIAFSAGLGICGLGILLAALPGWMLWALLGSAMLAGGVVILLGNR